MIDWLIDWLTNWLSDCLTDWLTDWLLAGWLAGGRTDWLTDWLSCDCRLCVHNYWYYHNSHSQCYYWCRFGDAGCYTLCDGLRRSRKLTSLSLNYCKLRPTSGTVLGYLVSTTAIMYVLTHPADVPEPSCFRVFCLSLHVCNTVKPAQVDNTGTWFLSIHLGGVSFYPSFILYIVSKWGHTYDIHLSLLST